MNDLSGLSGTGRYVRMYGTARGTRYGYSLWEFEVYGTLSGVQPTPPAAPSGLTATAVSSGQINLAWTDNSSDETGFAIDRATDVNFSQNLVTSTVGANSGASASASITGLSPSTTYYFRVHATNGGGASANSNTANATTSAAVVTSNLALGKLTVASSVETASFPASNATDGIATTRWSSLSSDPQWIYVDLGQSYNINRVVLKWETAYGKDFQIQVSNDASTWTTITSVTGGTGGVNDLSGLSGTGRYVRMYGTARGTRYGYSLWEFEVYGA